MSFLPLEPVSPLGGLDNTSVGKWSKPQIEGIASLLCREAFFYPKK